MCNVTRDLQNRGRPKFSFGFGFGTESWQMTSFGFGRRQKVTFRFRPKLTLIFGHQPKVYFNLRNATLVLLLVGLAYSACQAVSLHKAILCYIRFIDKTI